MVVAIVVLLAIGYIFLVWSILYLRTQDRKARAAMRLREAIENDYPLATTERMLAVRNAMRETIRKQSERKRQWQ